MNNGEKASDDEQVQSEEDIMKIIEEARIPGKSTKSSEQTTGSQTLDDETDDLEAELLDSDLSGDFVSTPI